MKHRIYNRGGLILVLWAWAVAQGFAQQAAPSSMPIESLDKLGKFPSATIWRLPLPEKQDVPLIVPTSPEDTTFIEVPVPVKDWMGRGFTLEPRSFAGDYHIRIEIGGRRIGVVPLVSGARRTLHLVLEDERLLTLDLAPAVGREFAWRAVMFYDQSKLRAAVETAARRERERMARPDVMSGEGILDDEGGSGLERDSMPPESRYQRPTTRSMDGMLSLLRASVGLSADRVALFSRANPSLQIAKHPGNPVNYGLYDIAVRMAIRDDITDTLGIAVALTNIDRNNTLLFDPEGWTVRVGERVYRFNAPGSKVMFPGPLEPGRSDMVYLVLGRSPDGTPTRLLPDNDFRVTARLMESTPAVPVQSIDLSTVLR